MARRSCSSFYYALTFVLMVVGWRGLGDPLPTYALSLDNQAKVEYIPPPGTDPKKVVLSNKTVTPILPSPTPADIRLFHYATSSPLELATDGGVYYDVNNTKRPLPQPQDSSGNPIPTTLTPIKETEIYRVGEPIFIQVTDFDKNMDPSVREFVEITVTTSTKDHEKMELQETGPNTGIFMGVIPGKGVESAMAHFNGELYLPFSSRVEVSYRDPDFPSDIHKDAGLVDPFGTVFDSKTWQPVNGAKITLETFDGSDTPPLAVVRGDDGNRRYPSSVISGPASSVPGPSGAPLKKVMSKSTDIKGGEVTDEGGQSYSFGPGQYRFPFVDRGRYKLVVEPPEGYRTLTVPSADLAGTSYTLHNEGSFGKPFFLELGAPVVIDIPLDRIQTPLVLEKRASKTEASAGDFLQYTLTLENRDPFPANGIRVQDQLPFGIRFESGSLRRNGVLLQDPEISSDGRTLTFALNTIEGHETVSVTYVVQVSAGTRLGPAINRAVASDVHGIESNPGEAIVQIREPFLSDVTIVGRVVYGDCQTPWENLQGYPNIRVMMEDGTSVITDANGQYHFRGVRPGTHVVQLDRASLPPYLTPVPCIDHSRFAGNPFSQFVDVQQGLWRADFYLGPKAPIQQGVVGIHMEGAMTLEEKKETSMPVTRSLQSGALFSTLSAKLRSVGMKELKKLVAEIKKMPVDRIEVVGHTDSREIHPVKQYLFKDNYVLSEARAQSVVDYLIKTLKISPQKIRAIGRGPDQPVATNQTRAGMARNRRVEVLVYVTKNMTREDPVGQGRHFRYRVAVDGKAEGVKKLRALVVLPPGVSYVASSTRINGDPASDPFMDGHTLTYPLGYVAKEWKQYVEFSGWLPAGWVPPSLSFVQRDISCPEEGFLAQTFALFENEAGEAMSTPTVQNKLLCPPRDTSLGFPDHSPIFIAQSSDRQATTVTLLQPPTPPLSSKDKQDREPLSAIEAAGGSVNWLAGQSQGIAWLFPGWDHNPRSPAIRIVIKHLPGQKVVLTHQDQEVDPLYLDAVESNDTVAVTIWRGIPLVEGRNLFRASVYNARGRLVETLTRLVHYANSVAYVELVSEKSLRVADGLQNPVIAVRLLDRYHRPVHSGLTGNYEVNEPYRPAEIRDATQQRQLAGNDRFDPKFVVSGDEGIAYIELAPTLASGEVIVTIHFYDGKKERTEPVRVWLEPALRDWVLVGFAEGDVRYETLSGNMEGLDPKDRKNDLITDGEVSFYAKGRVLGKWLLTLAYNSAKPSEERDRRGLFSGIDPDQFYTLYGDRTEPVYDAASQKKLYLKLSRDQFYILLGDYDTGLTETQLARYNRSFTGIKTEYRGSLFDVVAYQAETDLHFVKDEIQGNGTSGLYPLSKGGIVINSEKIRIATRDRIKSEQIVETRNLARHLDYDIDYLAGTLFFREPIQSRDPDFNPIFIIAEYETVGPSGETLMNAGGRIGVHLWNDRVDVGVSHIRDETFFKESDLSGLDMTMKLWRDSRLRIEGAQSKDFQGGQKGDASLVEWEHHDTAWDTLLYIHRQEASFGMGQQSSSETGTQKEGWEGRVHLTPHLSLDTEVLRQENLAITANRDLGKIQFRHHTDGGSVYAGGEFAEDAFQEGTRLRSEQAIVGGNRFFLDKKMDVSVSGTFPLENKNGSESIDFPLRYRLGVNYALTDSVRLLMVHEMTDGVAFDTGMTRVGFQAIPWKGARLTQTLNQEQISEYGPRTFGAFGLTQSFLVSDRWGFDLAADSNRTFKERGTPPPVFNLNHPMAAGGMIGEAPPPEDFLALSGGVTYRAEQWSWNARAENRDAETTERYGITTNFLRQTQAGVAFGLSAQAFQTEDIRTQTKGLLQNVSLSWAYRPLGSSWSVLDRLEFRQDLLRNATGNVMAMNFGVPRLPLTGSSHSRRLINNIAINRVSKLWTNTSPNARTSEGTFYRNQRNQASLYYGMKYVLDQIDAKDYKGYTDLTGLEWRYDLLRWLDIGVQAGMLHSWKVENYQYTAGPSLGLSPVKNSWITVGYNVVGFYDYDFRDAGYTRKGPYLRLRIKFDESSLGEKK